MITTQCIKKITWDYSQSKFSYSVLLLIALLVSACTNPNQVVKWEYMTLSKDTKGTSIYSSSDINNQITVDKLTELGKVGWELCSTIPITRSDYRIYPGQLRDIQTTEVVLIFKRKMLK